MTSINVVSPKSDAKFWPADVDVAYVVCPWCGQTTQSFIGVVKEMKLSGRDDDCRSCDKTIIVEAFEHGVIAVQAECKPLWP